MNSIPKIIIHPKNMQFMKRLAFFFGLLRRFLDIRSKTVRHNLSATTTFILMLCSTALHEEIKVQLFVLSSELSWGKAVVAYTKPQQGKKEESEQLRGEGDQINLIDLNSQRWQGAGFRKASRQGVPYIASPWDEWLNTYLKAKRRNIS